MSARSPEELVAALADGTLPPAEFRHREHVRAAWHLLRTLPPDDAFARFEAVLRSYAAAIGMPDLFHATITGAYLRGIAAALDRTPRDASWDAFAAANAALFERRFLSSRYRPETLASPRARLVYLPPDSA